MYIQCESQSLSEANQTNLHDRNCVTSPCGLSFTHQESIKVAFSLTILIQKLRCMDSGRQNASIGRYSIEEEVEGANHLIRFRMYRRSPRTSWYDRQLNGIKRYTLFQAMFIGKVSG